jgi:hypothetical protein
MIKLTVIRFPKSIHIPCLINVRTYFQTSTTSPTIFLLNGFFWPRRFYILNTKPIKQTIIALNHKNSITASIN